MAEATYRFENAKQGRAGCQNSACKADAVKIGKGELRFGTLVTFNEYTSWKWKHWGCVTPKQIANIQTQIGDLEGIDLDNDLGDILDGFDELDSESQEQVKYALQNGHVHDDVWKGDPELNRPGRKGINKRTPKKVANGEDASASDAEHSTPSKPKKRSKKAIANDDEDEPIPKKKAPRKRKAADDSETEAAPAKKRGKSKKAAVKDEDVDADEPAPEPPKRKARTKKVKAEPEYEPEGEAEAADPQVDEAADSDDVSAKALKKRGRKPVVKEEEPDDEETAVKPAKKSRAKKIKTEQEVEIEGSEPKATSRRSSRTSRAKA